MAILPLLSPFNPHLLPPHLPTQPNFSFSFLFPLPSSFSFSLSLSLFSGFQISTMKLIKNINPKHLFRCKKSRSDISKPDPFGSGSSSDSSDIKPATPNSVLPSRSPETSSDWSDISAEIHSELVQAFKLIDRDGDGKITRQEMEALLSRVGTEPPSEDELTTMLSEIDRDGDGCISLDEFSAISSAFAPPACGSELRDAFDFFDTDHDGKITAEELFAVFTSFGDDGCTLEDCRRMINGVDRNGDGFVCFDDFTRMMEQQR